MPYIPMLRIHNPMGLPLKMGLFTPFHREGAEMRRNAGNPYSKE